MNSKGERRSIRHESVQELRTLVQTALNAQQRWPGPWQQEISQLNQGNHLLGPNNRAFRDLLRRHPSLAQQADAFVASLQDPDRSADHAKDLLLQMRQTAQPTLAGSSRQAQSMNFPAWGGPSRFPTGLYADLLEVINAKRLWQTGSQELGPWPFDASALKPDYVVGAPPAMPGGGSVDEQAAAFYQNVGQVGDHVRITGRRTLDDVVAQFGYNVANKLSTYRDKQVRVVVDIADNEPLHAPYDQREFANRLLARLRNIDPAARNRLIQVDAVTPTGILRFRPADWA
jgi:hypothetical protein